MAVEEFKKKGLKILYEIIEDKKQRSCTIKDDKWKILLPQVRTIEEAQQKKAKEEEREKIVSIISTHRGYIPRDVFFEIQEAITRINN